MLVTQWFCKGCKRILDTSEVSPDKRHYKNDCCGECFIITADDIVENPTQKKFRELVNAIPLDVSIREEIRTDIESLQRYRWDIKMMESEWGEYLKYEDVMNVLRENRDNAKK